MTAPPTSYILPYSLLGLRGDDDDDDVPTKTPPNSSRDHDSDFDGSGDRAETHAGYSDRDDGRIVDFGRAATPTEAQFFISVVRRYDVAASRADGRGFCGLLQGQVARAAPREVGKTRGPAYRRRHRTCAAAMSGLLAHIHQDVSHPMVVTGVRVTPERALVLLGSHTSAASYLELELEHGHWTVAVLLPDRLP